MKMNVRVGRREVLGGLAAVALGTVLAERTGLIPSPLALGKKAEAAGEFGPTIQDVEAPVTQTLWPTDVLGAASTFGRDDKSKNTNRWQGGGGSFHLVDGEDTEVNPGTHIFNGYRTDGTTPVLVVATNYRVHAKAGDVWQAEGATEARALYKKVVAAHPGMQVQTFGFSLEEPTPISRRALFLPVAAKEILPPVGPERPAIVEPWPTTREEAALRFGRDDKGRDPNRWVQKGETWTLAEGEEARIDPGARVANGFFTPDGTNVVLIVGYQANFRVKGATIHQPTGASEARRLYQSVAANNPNRYPITYYGFVEPMRAPEESAEPGPNILPALPFEAPTDQTNWPRFLDKNEPGERFGRDDWSRSMAAWEDGNMPPGFTNMWHLKENPDLKAPNYGHTLINPGDRAFEGWQKRDGRTAVDIVVWNHPAYVIAGNFWIGEGLQGAQKLLRDVQAAKPGKRIETIGF